MLSSFGMFGRRLILGAVALTVLSAARRGLDVVTGLPRDSALLEATRFLDVVVEGTLPTWYSSGLLLIAAALVWHVLRIEKSRGTRRLWYLRGLVAGFVYLSIDETAAIHEQFTNIVQGAVEVRSSALQYSWVLVAIPLVVAAGLAYGNWIRRLPTNVRSLVIVGGIVFIMGGIGLEMASSLLQFGLGSEQLAALAGHGEELLEMLGVIVFIEAMMRYLADDFAWDGTLRFALRGPADVRTDHDDLPMISR